MKSNDLIIKEVEEIITDNYEKYSIGLRTHPQSFALLSANDVEPIYSENCHSENDAKKIVEYFTEKGMLSENRFSLNAAKGIYIITNNT
jgi:hypothetical protein